MKGNDRFVIWALAISLAIHAVFLTVVRFSRPVEAQERPPTHVTIQDIIHVPPPTPTPKPVVVHPQKSHPKTNPQVAVTVPRTRGGGKGATPGPALPTPGSNIGTGSDPSASPEPTDPPKPRCSAPYVAASVTNAVPAEAPEAAEGQTGVAQVKVNLSDTGAVLAVSIYATTGNTFLDSAALRAARQSSYRAETRDCMPVGGSYLFKVDFQN